MAFAKEKLVAQLGASFSTSQSLYLQSLKLRVGKCAALKLFRLVDAKGVPHCDHYAKRATFEDHWARDDSVSPCPLCSTNVGDKFKVKMEERWTRTLASRGEQSFYVEETTVEDARGEILEATDFCTRRDVELAPFAVQTLDAMTNPFSTAQNDTLVVARDAIYHEIRGFAIYRMTFFPRRLNMIKQSMFYFLDASGWSPSRKTTEKELWEEWVVEIMRDLPDIKNDDDYFDSEDFRNDIENRLFAFSRTHSVELDFLGGEYLDFGRWLYQYEGRNAIREMKDKQYYSDLVLICTDEEWSGYGLGKGLTRFIENATLQTGRIARKTVSNPTLSVYMTLVAVNSARIALYEGWGFRLGVGGLMYSPDLFAERLAGISEEEYQKNAEAFQERLKKRKR